MKRETNIDIEAFLQEANQYLNKTTQKDIIKRVKPKKEHNIPEKHENLPEERKPLNELEFLRNQLKSLKYPEIGIGTFIPEEKEKFINFCTFLIKKSTEDSDSSLKYRQRLVKYESKISNLESKCSFYEDKLAELNLSLKKAEKSKLTQKSTQEKEKSVSNKV